MHDVKINWAKNILFEFQLWQVSKISRFIHFYAKELLLYFLESRVGMGMSKVPPFLDSKKYILWNTDYVVNCVFF